MLPALPAKPRRSAHSCSVPARYRALSCPAGSASAICLRHRPSITPMQHHLLDLSDGLGGIQVLGAGFGAIHDGVAAIQPKRILETVQALPRRLIARVDDP